MNFKPTIAPRYLIPGILSLIVILVLSGGAIGQAVSADTGEAAGDVSPEVQSADGEQQILVYFETERDTITPADAPGQTHSEVIDTLEERADSAQQPLTEFAANRAGVSVDQQFWLGNVALVTLDHEQVDVMEIAATDGVDRIIPNFEVRIDTSTADTASVDSALEGPAGPQMPGVASTEGDTTTSSSDVTWGLDQVNAPAAWDGHDTQGEGVSVAVLDTGVDPDHQDIPDISQQQWGDWDEEGDERNTSPKDYDSGGHGTHVSGTVVGEDGSGTAIGVAPDATLYHGAVLNNCDQNGCFGSGAQIVAGMQWAVENDVNVLSMSLGGEGYVEGYIPLVRDSLDAGTIVVAASGNAPPGEHGEDRSASPGNIYDAIGVGAVNENEDVPTFSMGEVIDTDDAWGGYAPDDWPDEYTEPLVTAPGVDVKSAVPGNSYANYPGTSMAAPHVSGTIALMLSAATDDTSLEEVREALKTTTNHPDGDDVDNRYGHGIIDASAAVGEVAADPAEFTTTVQETNSPVDEGETLTVTAEVENTGEQSDTQVVELTIDGLTVDSSVESLDSGQSETVQFEWETESGDAGDHIAEVTSDDDSDSTSVSVEAETPDEGLELSVSDQEVEPDGETTVTITADSAEQLAVVGDTEGWTVESMDPLATMIGNPTQDDEFPYTTGADEDWFYADSEHDELTIDLSATVEEGEYDFTAEREDDEGNVLASEEFTITVVEDAPDELDVTVTRTEVWPGGPTTVTVSSEGAENLKITGDTEDWTIESMDPVATFLGNPTTDDELPYVSDADETWFYAEEKHDELTVSLSATVEEGEYHFTVEEEDADGNLVGTGEFEINVTEEAESELPEDLEGEVTPEQFAAFLPQGEDTTLSTMRSNIDEWVANERTIDGVSITLGELRVMIEWWSLNR